MPTFPQPSRPSRPSLPWPDAEPAVRLSGPGEVAAAVPLLLGFTPESSLVLVGLSGPRARLGMTLRMDLADPSEPGATCAPVASEVESMCREGAERMALSGAHSVVAVVYPPPGEPRGEAGRFLDPLGERLAAHGVELVDLLVVVGDRWWSAGCRLEACCPPEGTPLVTSTSSAGVTALSAATVLAGRAPLPDRAALAATVAPPPGPEREVLARAQRAASRRVRAALRGDPHNARAEAMVALEAAVTGFRRRPGLGLRQMAETLDGPPRSAVSGRGRRGAAPGWAAVVADLVVWLRDVPVRDAVTAWVLDDAPTLLPFLVELARLAVPPDDAPLCSVLAWAALSEGQGALANVALERALASEPTYSMALLVRESLNRQLPPGHLRTVLAESRGLNVLGPRLLPAG